MKINAVVALAIAIISARSALLNAKSHETNVSCDPTTSCLYIQQSVAGSTSRRWWGETSVQNYLALAFDKTKTPSPTYLPAEYTRKEGSNAEIKKIREKRSRLESNLKYTKEEIRRYQKASQVSFGIGLGAFTMLALGKHVIPEVFPVLGGLYMISIMGFGALLLLLSSKLSKDLSLTRPSLIGSLVGLTGLGFIGIGLALGLMGLGSLGSGVTAILALGGFAFGVLNQIRETKAQEASIKIEKEAAELKTREERLTQPKTEFRFGGTI